ncbi:hypothetical protein UFOVP579_12 [uncultured Caudovirales phage]|uniref:Uncharacterized protein n=1 Tax=uncultured Caudovirales phage TaxID=2100421 RepID=A0A6J5PFG5_9CAUD|nr:hypothetical protein UFOVP302_12 [uncultured Caudovirales phage]CAB4168656.1 hypothetical protein UFOVP579_12 [uncultured Caudovirales phage]
MKNLIVLLIALVSFTLTTTAQSTTPRWGNGVSSDNTGRALNWKYQTVTDATGADSTTLAPSAYQTVVRVAVIDSFYFKSPVVTKSYAGDNLMIVASGASGKKVKFAGTNFISAGTATISTNGRAVICFIFDGAVWVEKSRVVL